MAKLFKPKMPKIGVEGHWSSMKFSENILQDALIRHVLGLTYLQMGDIAPETPEERQKSTPRVFSRGVNSD